MNYHKINYTLVYNRLKKLNSAGEALIQIRCYQKGKSKYFSTGVYIAPKFWDKRYKRIKGNHPNEFILNKLMGEEIQKMRAFEEEMIRRSTDGFFPLAQIGEYKEKKELINSFSVFYKDELKHSTLKKGTKKSEQTTFNKLQAYRRHKTIYFNDLTFAFVKGFDRYLRGLELGQNTIQKHHKNLKKYIRLGIANGFLSFDDNPYLLFKSKSVEPYREFLNELELERLEQLEFDTNEAPLKKIRDFLLVSCYCGLRFSDVLQLSPNHIEETKEGLLITIQAKKTKKIVRIPLFYLFIDSNGASRAEQLIKQLLAERKEATNGHKAFNDLPFFKITNQYLNRQLKLVARKANINKNVTSHIGRRTFSSVLAQKGVQPKAIQKLLQHGTLEMTMKYIEMSNEIVQSELKKIKWS